MTTSKSDIAIRVENLSKIYQKKNKEGEHEDFYALKDVSFEIKKGESVGIIGKNGSGKSTLLKILSGVSKPSSGYVEVNGTIASILDVGTGFHPDLSGRENIYLRGELLSFNKNEINKFFENIVAFSEIGEFIDAPVKSYSSGMFLRLAFSIVVHLKAEIILLDEVLNVGDAAFQYKVNKLLINKNKQLNSTIIFVSHDMNAIKETCDSFMEVEKGLISKKGDSSLISIYLDKTVFSKINNDNLPLGKLDKKIDIDNFAELLKLEVLSKSGNYINEDEEIIIKSLFFYKEDCQLDISFSIKDLLLNTIVYSSTMVSKAGNKRFKNKRICFSCSFPKYSLTKGKYFLALTVVKNEEMLICNNRNVVYFEINGVSDKKLIKNRPQFLHLDAGWEITEE